VFSTLRKLSFADTFTLANLFFGFFAIFTGSVNYLFISAIMDGADGMVARSTGSGEFGKELDSLADLLSFGFLPSFFLLKSFGFRFLVFVVSFAYVACAAIRLARFNVTESRNFVGLPVTASALLLAALLSSGERLAALYLTPFLSLFMVCDVVYPKIRDGRILFPASIVVFLAFFGITAPLIVLCVIYIVSPLLRGVPGVYRLWG